MAIQNLQGLMFGAAKNGLNSRRPSQQPIHVVITSSHALPHIGGIQVLVDREIREHLARGCRVTLITSDIGGEGDTPQYPESVQVRRVWASSILERKFGLYFPLFGPSLLIELWRAIRSADLVHAHAWVALNSCLALVLARMMGVTTVLTEHNGIQPRKTLFATTLFRILANTMGRLSVAMADRCDTYNARVMKDLRRIGGRHKVIEFVPYAIDTELFRPPSEAERVAARAKLNWDSRRKKVLFVGRLVAEKGIPQLLQIVDPGSYDLVFCGAGDVSILGPLPRPGVEYLTPRKHKDLVSVYHAADLLVLPSIVEGFPLVAREAMACGLPVILAYDEGYEPYRGTPLLTFCQRDPQEIRESIRKAFE